MSDIDAIIGPKSIAVVGATNRHGSVGLAVFQNILKGGFQGVLYPVNPKARSVQSVRTYPSLNDINDDIDMAVIIVPATAVEATIIEAGKKGVKGAVVITAGFKEVGGSGIELEKQIQRTAKEYKIRLVGPNCLGVINNNPNFSMNASFATKMPKAGNLAFISQSGALCTAVLDYADGKNIGFSKFVSFGNKADVNEIDLLHYLKEDPDTDVILMYLENISNGRAFLEVAREIVWSVKKPILAVKSGRSPEGAKAAASHTGSLAGADSDYDAIFQQSGVLRVEDVGELFHVASAMSSQPFPKGNRIAIVTNAGGPGIMATDAAARYGLKISQLSDQTKDVLKENLPPTASINNPVDVIGDATHERYETAIRAVLQDENVDGAIVILSPQAMTDILETAEILPHVIKGINKPVLCSFMGIVDVSKGINFLEEHNIPNYNFPEYAVHAMSMMVRYGELLQLKHRTVRRMAADRDTASSIIRRKLMVADQIYLPEKEANEILSCYGFPVLKNIIVDSREKAAEAVEELCPPVVMKIHSPDIIHKFDVGGVRLNINTSDEARNAYDEIIANAKKFKPDARITGILMVRQVRKGIEVIIGATRDPNFGPICMFGLGGTFVEALRDVTFRIAPMWEVSSDIMVRQIKAYKLLQGVRGAPPSDVEAIKDCILRLSQMVADHPEIAELDINPLIVFPEGEGCVVTDSRILLKKF